MILVNNTLLSVHPSSPSSYLTTTLTTSVDLNQNSTVEINNTSSFGIILTIIILSCLSVSGWLFMSYALLSRSEAYRAKPEDQFGTSNLSRSTERPIDHDCFVDFD